MKKESNNCYHRILILTMTPHPAPKTSQPDPRTITVALPVEGKFLTVEEQLYAIEKTDRALKNNSVLKSEKLVLQCGQLKKTPSIGKRTKGSTLLMSAGDGTQNLEAL